MAHDVIMPALGMAQETGLILTWHKKPGDPVSAGDVLIEVETDKAAMEVEAQADGFLTDLRAQEGEEVPVGTVIAVISKNPEDAPEAGVTQKPASPQVVSPPAAPSTAPQPDADKSAVPAASAVPVVSESEPRANGKVLASPKAKRLALERGIELEQLVKSGASQPVRTADLDRIGMVPAEKSAEVSPSVLRARASVETGPFDRFKDWLAGEGAVETGDVLASFAAGSLRPAKGLESICVLVTAPRMSPRLLSDPDRQGLCALETDESGRDPDIIVYDLTGSRLLDADLAALHAPTLTIGQDEDRLSLTLSAAPSQMSDVELISCLDGFAARLEDPLRQLL